MPAAAISAMIAGSTASAGTGAARNAVPGTVCVRPSSSGPSAPIRPPPDPEAAGLRRMWMKSSSKFAIRTAVFPVAGRGTRFLPATKASPKEMLPVVDKPLIQYAVEEALAAGARRLVFITGASKRAIEDHFDSDQELELMLEQQGKSDLLNQVRSVLPSYASCIYIRQPAPLGLGHAVLCAQPAVGAEPFFVHLADDLIRSEVACLAQMAQVYEAKRASVLGVQAVPRQDTEKYGIVALEADRAVTSRVRSIVEKPKPAVAPSNLAVVGRYVLAPAIFEHLEKQSSGAGGPDVYSTQPLSRPATPSARPRSVAVWQLPGSAGPGGAGAVLAADRLFEPDHRGATGLASAHAALCSATL